MRGKEKAWGSTIRIRWKMRKERGGLGDTRMTDHLHQANIFQEIPDSTWGWWLLPEKLSAIWSSSRLLSIMGRTWIDCWETYQPFFNQAPQQNRITQRKLHEHSLQPGPTGLESQLWGHVAWGQNTYSFHTESQQSYLHRTATPSPGPSQNKQ